MHPGLTRDKIRKELFDFWTTLRKRVMTFKFIFGCDAKKNRNEIYLDGIVGEQKLELFYSKQRV